MKIYLDDKRDSPKGWIKVTSAGIMIAFLDRYDFITHISLDHDLGDENKKGTGYDVLLWIENKVATSNYSSPEIFIHTANPSAREKMEAAVKQIYRLENK